MRANQRGFGIVELLIVVTLLGALVAIGLFVFSRNNQPGKDVTSNRLDNSVQTLEIKNWPVRIGAFDQAINLAGDVYLNKEILVTNQPADADQRPLAEVGWKRSRGPGSGETFINPTIDFVTRPGAPLLSVSDGYVTHISRQQAYGRDDYEIHIQPTQGQTTQWLVIYDHAVKPLVKEGDKVKAGQQIGETGPWGGGQPYDFIELQVNYYPDPANQQHSEGRCPSLSIGNAYKQKLTDELKQVTSAWETLMGDTSIYNEAGWVAPGCIVEKAEL